MTQATTASRTFKMNSLELIELSSINKVSLVEVSSCNSLIYRNDRAINGINKFQYVLVYIYFFLEYIHKLI